MQIHTQIHTNSYSFDSKFAEINKGECFFYHGNLFMKTSTLTDLNDIMNVTGVVNAVVLKTGMLIKFDDDANVMYAKCRVCFS